MKYTICRWSTNYFWKTDHTRLRDRCLAMPLLLFPTQQTTFLPLPAFISSLKARATAYLENSLWFILMRFGKLAGFAPRADSSAQHIGSHRWVSPWSAGPQQCSAQCPSLVMEVQYFNFLSMDTSYHRMGKPLESHLIRACFLTRSCTNTSSFIHEVLFLDCCPSCMQLWHSPSANLHSNKTLSFPCSQQANTKILCEK